VRTDSALKRTLWNPTLARFVLVGIANTFIGLTVIYLLKWLTPAGDSLANLIGYVVGFLFSFTFNSKWTFRFRGATWVTFVKFACVVAAAYLVNLGIVLLAVRGLRINSYLGQAMGILPYSAITFLGCKYSVFVPRVNAGE
jgi:putative flippase GtrA